MDKKLLADNNPELLIEWDYDKNANICSPYDIGAGSSKKVWWKCKKCGSSYEARIADRTKGVGCPYCAGKKPIVGKTDLATTRPDLLREWNYEKNDALGVSPVQVTKGSTKKVWWKCNNNHEWQASINNRNNGAGCPFCSGRKAIKGETDLASKRPYLLNEWYYEKNSSICNPEEVTLGSHTKVWWKCKKCGHEWQAAVKSRVLGNGCPYCSNKRIEQGFNDLTTRQPALLLEWDYKKNTIDPKTLTSGSNKKVWWKCSVCGHEWAATVANRVAGSGCPVCARERNAQNRKKAKSENSLSSLHPQLLEEWDYERNGDLSPDTVNVGSPRRVWWKCKKCNQHYLASVSNRTNGAGCPICAGKIIVSGINDLKKWCIDNKREDILAEWDYEKNEISPDQIAPFSSKKVYFVCKEGHSYISALSSRTKNNTGCPECEKNHKSSFPEQAVFYYLNNHFVDVQNSYHEEWLGKQELDVYIPSINTAVEYDGVKWHKNKVGQEIKKDLLCKQNGIRLIRIREDGLNNLESSECIFVDPRKKRSLDAAIITVIKDVCGNDTAIDVDVDRDTAVIVARFDKNKKENSILSKFPELADEWDYEKNGSINPEYVNYGSTRKYWWKCKKCGNEFLMAVNSRTNQGQGCPVCAKEKRVESISKTLVQTRGSLQDSCSPLLEEWDYEKNTVTPAEITPASKRKVWWICKTCGGSWLASVQNRVLADNKCPYCAGRKVLVGFNDFATQHPELLSEWDYEKNKGLKPEDFTSGSGKIIAWKCSKCGHEWTTSISDRSMGRGCPICARKKAGTQSRKKVKCIETNMVFDSITEAAKWANINMSSLVGHLKGKSKTSGGYHWKYIE